MASDAPMYDGSGDNGGDDALSELAEQYGGPEQLVAALGYEFADDEPEAPQADPYVTRQEFEQHHQAGPSQQEQVQYIEAADQHIGAEIDQINATLKQQGNRELTEQQERLIIQAALVNTPPGHMPDVRAMYEDFTGPPEPPDLDKMTRYERDKWMGERLRELNQAS